jgi:hypothetical protein
MSEAEDRQMNAPMDSRKVRFKNFFGAVVPALVALSLSPTQARADFLDDLFGSPEPAVRVAPSTGSLPGSSGQSARVKAEVRAQKTVRAAERHSKSLKAVTAVDTKQVATGSKPVQAALCASEPAIKSSPPSSLLLYDKTLRAGDVLVTDKGIQVFHGQAACPHTARDFVALSTANVAKSRRSVLMAIEEATRRPSGYLVTAKSE